jgi:hypothetical protein
MNTTGCNILKSKGICFNDASFLCVNNYERGGGAKFRALLNTLNMQKSLGHEELT